MYSRQTCTVTGILEVDTIQVCGPHTKVAGLRYESPEHPGNDGGDYQVGPPVGAVHTREAKQTQEDCRGQQHHPPGHSLGEGGREGDGLASKCLELELWLPIWHFYHRQYKHQHTQQINTHKQTGKQTHNTNKCKKVENESCGSIQAKWDWLSFTSTLIWKPLGSRLYA